MPHTTKEVVKCTREELNKVLKENVRPPLAWSVSPPDANEKPLDVIKKEVTVPTVLKVFDVPIEEFLSDQAKKLYNTRVHSLVQTLFQNPQGELFLPEPVDPPFNNVSGIPQPGGGWFIPPCTWMKTVALVCFAVKTVPLIVDNDVVSVSEGYRRRWGHALSALAEKRIWGFGTFSKAKVVPLQLDAEGKPLLSFDEQKAMLDIRVLSSEDPRKKTITAPTDEELRERIAVRGQSGALLTYICTSPSTFTEEERKLSYNAELLNKKAGFPIFVDEGHIGSIDWSMLPY